MNLYKFLFAFGLVCLFSSCFNYETQYEGPYSDSENTGGSFPKELVYVAGGKVFLADRFVEAAITLDDSGSVKVASINNDHTKVIYKTANANIQIYDIETETVTGEVPGSENAVWFDFHSNNETIYFLDNNILDTFGPEILPSHPLDLGALPGVSGDIVYGVTITPTNRIYFSIASSSTNTEYLYSTNGTVILNTRIINEIRSDFRLSPDNSDIWMTVDDGLDDVLIVNTSNLVTTFSLSDVVYGVPTIGTNGYVVTRLNEILTPQNNRVEISNSPITSVDF